MTIFGHCFANCMFIFHKTEVQTVILRCLMSLNLNWYKSYDKKHKNAKKNQKMQTSVFVKNGKKKEMEIFAYCFITFDPIISKTC